ncbi:thymidine phosphorylase [Myxococcota bacterium]|nr:thymidine phosphorylase [Myxococcota bacterium]
MLFQDIIIKKREGLPLTAEEIHFFVTGYVKGEIPDYQASALLMAIFLKGLSGEELGNLTNEMIDSGIRVDFSAVSGIKVDKHSTGGVGDKISIPLAPLVAACGVKVPMVSGRGLGHTGGTLDKLESIPGFNVGLSIEAFIEMVDRIGLSMIGQTKELAPADKLIYALRDATGTVPSIPLISSSIMSKKLAEGIDALVLDVKVGTGAFMPTEEKAETLARTLVDIGKRAGKQVTAFLTRMDDPLGEAVGNSSEIIESIEILKGRGPEDIKELTFTLAKEMLLLARVASTGEEAIQMLDTAIADGSALAKFREMIVEQGGNPEVTNDYSLLPSFAHVLPVVAPRAGYVQAINSTEIGMAGVLIGAGRAVVSDTVDHGVGIKILAKSGDYVKQGQPLVEIQYNDHRAVGEAASRIASAYVIGDAAPLTIPLIRKVIR